MENIQAAIENSKISAGKSFKSHYDLNPPANVELTSTTSINSSAILITQNEAKIKLGKETYIGRFVELNTDRVISIGDHSSILDRSVIVGDITIGRYCVFSMNIFLSSGNHYFRLKPELYIRLQDQLLQDDEYLKSTHHNPIVIEDDCWLGWGAVVFPGVTIHKGSVIGAYAIVNKDVPPYSVVAGTPGKVISQRLNFEPKRMIKASLSEDLPYFYSGIYSEEFAENKDYLRVSSDFRVVLKVNPEADKTIVLKLSKDFTRPVAITLGKQRIEFESKDITSVSFQLEEPNGFLNFHLELDSGFENVFIHEAFVS
ncbi:acyltransferase [Leptospira sp. 'Mane']|uniref:acyltransferase n=1 Tax=Leptospira sp. 'Mane' TaxID=3387407 RepID=UPI00398BAC99